MSLVPDFRLYQQKPLAVALHDAGAANLVISWLKYGFKPLVRANIGGPAEMLWSEAFPEIRPTTLLDSISGAEGLLCGTGWASTLEYDAMCYAKSMNIPVIAVIDHWVNYQQRFIRNKVAVLPDEIWVSDKYAFAEASYQFPNVSVRRFKNLYLIEQVQKVLAAKKKVEKLPGAIRILYVLEPIREAWSSKDKPGEFQALDYFLSKIQKITLNSDFVVKLRPHPSDPMGKYDEWVDLHHSGNIYVAPETENISESIAWADIVVGCESFALIIALESGLKVISTLPPWGHKIRLPHKDIIMLNEL